MEITKESTVAEVVSKNLGSDHVFSKYKIDFCCGGGMSLEAACKESGVAFETIKEEIETINSKISGTLNTTDVEIPDLIDRAKDTYHTYISDTLFEILPYAAKVAEVHGTENKEVLEINELTKGIDEVITQMLKNSILSLYPIINEIVELAEKPDLAPGGRILPYDAILCLMLTGALSTGEIEEVANLLAVYCCNESAPFNIEIIRAVARRDDFAPPR